MRWLLSAGDDRSEGVIEEPKDQVVEIGHRIGFRPEPNPSVGKRLVAHAKEHGIVIDGFELAATLYDAQFVPPVCGERAVELLDDLLDPLHDAIEPDLLFNQAGPQEVVIAVIRGMPYKSAAEIGFSCHGQIGDLDINVAAVGPLHEQQLVRLICSFRLQLSEYLGGALRAVGDENFPLAGRAIAWCGMSPDLPALPERIGRATEVSRTGRPGSSLSRA